MPGIVILLFIDKGVTVAHRPTKLSPSRHFRCGLVINECWKKVEYFNRSSTVMTSLLFCFICYLGEMRNLQTWYITCLPKVNIAAWNNKSKLQFYWLCFYVNKCPNLFTKPEPKIRFDREMLWLSAGRLPPSSNNTATSMVGIRPEQASQTLVFRFCSHNRKFALSVRLNTNKVTISPKPFCA